MAALAQEIMDAFALMQCAGDLPISAHALPAQLTSSPDFERTLAALGRDGFTLSQGSAHSLTFEGWLASNARERVAPVIEHTLNLYREQAAAGVMSPKVEWQTLRARAGLSIEDAHFALWILRASKVVGTTSLRQADFSGTAPHEYQRWLKITTLDQFLQVFRREEREELAVGQWLTSEQRAACREVFRSLLTDKLWPSVQVLEIQLDEQQVDLTRALSGSLMRVAGEGSKAAAYLTLYGLIALDEAQDDVTSLIQLLRILGHRYANETTEAKHAASTVFAEASVRNDDQARRILTILSAQGEPFMVENATDLPHALIGTSRAFLPCRSLTGVRSLCTWLAKTWPVGPPVPAHRAAAPFLPDLGASGTALEDLLNSVDEEELLLRLHIEVAESMLEMETILEVIRDENKFNLLFVKLLQTHVGPCGWSVADGSMGGRSDGSGPRRGVAGGEGRRDWVVHDGGRQICVSEALRCNGSVDAEQVTRHVNKLGRYDAVGRSFAFVVAYVELANFEQAAQRYREVVATAAFSDLPRKSLGELVTHSASMKLLESLHTRNGMDVTVHHLLVFLRPS